MNKEQENLKFKEHLWALIYAQGRMIDRWSDGDDAVKKELWGELHSKGAQAREYLESIGSKINAY